MKKIITLLFCASLSAAAFAQPNQFDHNRDYHGNAVYQRKDYTIARRNMEIQRIINRYDFRIETVSRDRSLNRRERKFAIRALQAQKAEQINNVYARYSNVYNDHNNRNRDYREDHRNNN